MLPFYSFPSSGFVHTAAEVPASRNWKLENGNLAESSIATAKTNLKAGYYKNRLIRKQGDKDNQKSAAVLCMCLLERGMVLLS
jgi:hypothetical protein